MIRRSKAAQKKLVDNSKLRSAWRKWRRECIEALLAGPYGEPTRALLTFLKTVKRPTELVEFVKAGPWREADADVRNEILGLVDAVIIRQRERMGLAPFDDALPGQPPNAFLILREYLVPESPSADGATRGAARSNQTDTLSKDDDPCLMKSPLMEPETPMTVSTALAPAA
jgi:hypothetical protein